MKKTEKTDEYQSFYAELPFNKFLLTDYPADIEITQAYDEAPEYRERPGLSAEQVSMIARDSLESTKPTSPAHAYDGHSPHDASNRS